MKRVILGVCLACAMACASLPHTPDGKLDVMTLLDWAQYGIDADCNFGKGALAANICKIGTDGIIAARAAYMKDPVAGRMAVKNLLDGIGMQYPAVEPYWKWLTDAL